MSKNTTLTIFIVLFLAVGFLYIKEFSTAKPEAVEAASENSLKDTIRNSSANTIKVAFIYGDSINKNYTYSIKTMEKLAKDQKSAEERVKAKYSRAQERYQQLMQQAQTMTSTEMQQAQAELQKLEQDIQTYQQNIAAELQQSEIDAQTEYLKRVHEFLQEYNETQGYDIIFNYQQGGSILKMDSAYDITNEVVQGLNDRYEAELGANATKK